MYSSHYRSIVIHPITRWWYTYPFWKIVVNWDCCSQHMKKNMFQTTNQIVKDLWSQYTTITGWWCNNHLKKYEYEFVNGFRMTSHILWKKHVPNHQPVTLLYWTSVIWVRELGWWQKQYRWNNQIHVPNHQPAIDFHFFKTNQFCWISRLTTIDGEIPTINIIHH